MDFGVVLASAFITTLAFIGLVYYFMFKATPES